MTANRILVTGATGFVGGAVVLELLSQTKSEIVCLVRSQNDDEARTRLHSALQTAAHAYGLQTLGNQIEGRCTVLRADLSNAASCASQPVPQADLMVHAAASLKYADRDWEEISRMNIDGTANALEIAHLASVKRFCHVSTAYVAGTRTGAIGESDDLPTAELLNNWYERSKVQGEHLVRGADIPTVVVRPSIVIGHSQTYAATSFSGMYGMVDEILRFKRGVAKRLGSYLAYNPIRILADPDATLNLIPIDVAARAIVSVALSGPADHTFHIVNSTPPTVGACFQTGFDLLDMPSPTFVNDDGQLNDLDRKLQTDFYDSYLKNSKQFVANNTRRVVGDSLMDIEMPAHEIRTYLEWYLDSGFRKGQRLSHVTAPVVAAQS